MQQALYNETSLVVQLMPLLILNVLSLYKNKINPNTASANTKPYGDFLSVIYNLMLYRQDSLGNITLC